MDQYEWRCHMPAIVLTGLMAQIAVEGLNCTVEVQAVMMRSERLDTIPAAGFRFHALAVSLRYRLAAAFNRLFGPGGARSAAAKAAESRRPKRNKSCS